MFAALAMRPLVLRTAAFLLSCSCALRQSRRINAQLLAHTILMSHRRSEFDGRAASFLFTHRRCGGNAVCFDA